MDLKGLDGRPLRVMKTAAAALCVFFSCVAALAGPDCVNEKQPVLVALGAEFSVCLKSNRTTGYGWRLADKGDEAVVKLVRSRYDGPESKVPGAGGTEIFTFKGTGVGVSHIRLEYSRSWEKNAPPAKETTVEVKVHKPKR